MSNIQLPAREPGDLICVPRSLLTDMALTASAADALGRPRAALLVLLGDLEDLADRPGMCRSCNSDATEDGYCGHHALRSLDLAEIESMASHEAWREARRDLAADQTEAAREALR